MVAVRRDDAVVQQQHDAARVAAQLVASSEVNAAGTSDEDALFEQAALMRSFASVLPAALIDGVAAAGGAAGGALQQQSQRSAAAASSANELALAQAMDVDTEAIGAGGAEDTWLAWRPAAAEVNGNGETGTDVSAAVRQAGASGQIAFALDPLGGAARSAAGLSGTRRPADAYACPLYTSVAADE